MLQNELEKLYHKYFKDSQIVVRQQSILGKPYIDIRCYLVANKSELSHGIYDNDMLRIHISLEAVKDLPDKIKFEYLSRSYIIKPQQDYYYCSYRNLTKRTRTLKRDTKTILKEFDSLFKKLHDSLMEDIKNDNIHENYKELLNKRIIL